jgi:pimeloyl-ACP methyl ester carboxylesterase
MIETAKEDLVIVHSFPTNSNLLGGFYDYLGTFFNVHPIDLPGFSKTTPPLREISIPNYAHYVEDQLEELNLDSFILGGVSFGFAVVNKVAPDKKCLGLLAMEPYLNAESLHLGAQKRLTYKGLLRLASASGLGAKAWGSPFLNRFISSLLHYPVGRIETMTGQIDARTFLDTAQIILDNTNQPRFTELPHALVVNPSDATVNYDHLVGIFRRGVGNLHIVHTQVDHYPKDMSPEYFRERINEEDILDMIDWFRQVNRF